ncbi:hypothetical protein BJ878DRAFT_164944 [Calycina marina]|uniref:Velvet domain-containing protein n=1 Tax=Calycina marina TaxID=1763456 RepID=A0A9P7YYX3_9HELO|nr:hypothetical protein BJ878DRAFT_164944 [Calycina marina]
MRMIDLSVQPPAQTRPGVALFPPVAARLSSRTNLYNDLSQIFAFVSLVYENGEQLDDQLSGNSADCAHPIPGSGRHVSDGRHARDQAYFYFPDLVIHYPGRYRIRVTLMRMEYDYETSEAASVVQDYVDSRSIVVHEGISNYPRPDERERAFLRMLHHDGQYVPNSY